MLRGQKRLCAVGVALLLAGCQALPTWLGGPGPEGKVGADFFANAAVTVGGRNFQLRALDNKALADVTVQAAGKNYRVVDGKLFVPESALREAKEDARGFFRVFAEGYAPKQVWIAQPEDVVYLSPINVLATELYVPQTGAVLQSKNGAVALEIPPGLLDQPQTAVTMSNYTPTITDAEQAQMAKDRSNFMSELLKNPDAAKIVAQGAGNLVAQGAGNLVAQGAGNVVAQGAGNYGLLAAAVEDCEYPENPLPCPPVTLGLGVLLVVDGELNPGPLNITYDLDAMSVEKAGYKLQLATQQPALDPIDVLSTTVDDLSAGVGHVLNGDGLQVANRLKKTIDQIDVIGPAAKGLVESQKGIRITGHKLRFGINLNAGDVTSRMARVRVDGFMMLGVKMEVTVVSKLATLPLPLAVLRPIRDVEAILPPLDGLLDPDDADPLVAGNTGNIVAGNTSNVLSNNGGSITGTVNVPMLAAAPKFGLLDFAESAFEGSPSVAVLDADGNVLVPAQVTGSNGKFDLHDLPTTPQLLVLEARAGGNTLRTLVQAPGATVVKDVELGPASTVATAYALEALDTGEVPSQAIDLTGFKDDVQILRRELKTEDAFSVLTAQPSDNSTRLRNIWTALGRTPSLVPGGAASADTLAGSSRQGYQDGVVGNSESEPQFRSPTALALGANGEVFVADETDHRIRKIVPATGTVTTLAGDGNSGLQDGTGTGARFNHPTDIVRAADGFLYVLDSGNTTIRRVNPVNGAVTTLSAGSDPQSTTYQTPCSLAATLEGDLLVGDRGTHRIYLVKRPGTQQQSVEVLVGNGSAGTADGVGTQATVKSPDGLAVHPGSGDVYFTDDHKLRVIGFGTNKLRDITPVGKVLTVAGTSTGAYEDGDVSVARFRQPTGMCFDAAGNLLIADRNNNCIRKFARASNLVTTAAGGRNSGFADGNGADIRFTHPVDVVEGFGNVLYVADLDNFRVRKVTGY